MENSAVITSAVVIQVEDQNRDVTVHSADAVDQSLHSTVNGTDVEDMDPLDDDEEEGNSEDELEETYSYHRFQKHPVSIRDTKYRWFFLFAGLLSPRTLKKHSLSFTLFLYVHRIFVASFMIFFFLVKFGVWFQYMSWLILERKYPFTVINYVIWELKWVLTYFLALYFLSQKGLDKFLRRVELPIEKWRTYRRPMFWYTMVVALVLVVIPCIFTMLDVNWFNLHKRDTMTFIQNIMISIFVILFRLLVLPGFCMLTIILYLLGEHMIVTGKRLCVQRTIGDAERLVINLRKFIRKTEASLNWMVFVHMLLIFSSSFTTLMSTIERLEVIYTRPNVTASSMHVNFHENTLPLFDLIETNTALQQAKQQLKLVSAVGPRTESSGSEVIKGTEIQQAYTVVTKLQEKQLNLMQDIVRNRNNNNITATYSESKPPLYQMVMTITESYNKIRIMLDTLFTMMEILLLYMSPLFLISRTDTKVREVLDMVLEIDIEQQQEFYAVKNSLLKERLTDLLKETSGIRICGYQVQFFKSLIMASLGAFFAIALRGIWKHFGFFS